MARNSRRTPTLHPQTPVGRITVEQVSLVGRSGMPCQVRGTDYTLTIDELIKTTVRGDWEGGYYQLTPAGAARATRDINTKLQVKDKEPVTT